MWWSSKSPAPLFGRWRSCPFSYAFSLQQRSGKDVETQSGPSKTDCNQNENTTDVSTEHDPFILTKSTYCKNMALMDIRLQNVTEKWTQTKEESTTSWTRNTRMVMQSYKVWSSLFLALSRWMFITSRTDFQDHLSMNSPNGRPSSFTTSAVPTLANQMCFLSPNDQGNCTPEQQDCTSAQNAVLISSTARAMPSQFALMGGLRGQQSALPPDPRVMLNTNVPFSAFICGVQGSGKSHTTSCIIGNIDFRGASFHKANLYARELLLALAYFRSPETATLHVGAQFQWVQLECWRPAVRSCIPVFGLAGMVETRTLHPR